MAAHPPAPASSDILSHTLFEINEQFESYRSNHQISNDDDAFNTLQDSILHRVNTFSSDTYKVIQELNQISIYLSTEKDVDKILYFILTRIVQIIQADALTLYFKDRTGRFLNFKYVYNHTLGIQIGENVKTVDWKPLPLFKEDGAGNTSSIAALCALTAKTIIIDDVYANVKFDFEGAKQFDLKTGYTTQSMLVIPIKNHFNILTGVLQLINKQSGGITTQFDETDKILALSFASQAAIALHRARQQKLLEYLQHKIYQEKNIEKLLIENPSDIEESDKTDTPSENVVTTASAEAFMRDMKDDLGEEFYEMEDIEQAWDYEHSKHQVNSNLGFEKLSQLSARYARAMRVYHEFLPLSQSLEEMAQKLASLTRPITGDERVRLLDGIESLGDELAQWRRTIFIDKNTDNIHYLDQTITESCQKIASF